MAKARATCTCATCGKVFEITAYKVNSREARQFEEWAAENITECNECKEKRLTEEHAAENEKAANAAKEKNWPTLIGSEKQVAWANTIREAGMNGIFSRVDNVKEHMHGKPDLEDAYRIGTIATELMLEKTSASWWIDNRDSLLRSFLRLCDHVRNNPAEYVISKAEEADLKDDAITVAEPEQRAHDGIVDITVAEGCVSATYRKDDSFREVVKTLSYSWNGGRSAWCLQIGETTGTAQERAAELGNKLLNAGFAIRIQDPDTLRNAIEGNYEPMTHRWIRAQTNSKGFSIAWSYGDDVYWQARKLPGAKYASSRMLVPAREYEAVLDFAEAYGFHLTPDAQRLVDSLMGTVVVPAARKDAAYDEHPISEILSSSREIIDDLKD